MHLARCAIGYAQLEILFLVANTLTLTLLHIVLTKQDFSEVPVTILVITIPTDAVTEHEKSSSYSHGRDTKSKCVRVGVLFLSVGEYALEQYKWADYCWAMMWKPPSVNLHSPCASGVYNDLAFQDLCRPCGGGDSNRDSYARKMPPPWWNICLDMQGLIWLTIIHSPLMEDDSDVT